MNVGCVPVNECVVQLEFEHKIAQSILCSGARLISTIGARRQNAQSIGSASVHYAEQVVDGETAGRENFWIWVETPTRRVESLSRVKWFCLRPQIGETIGPDVLIGPGALPDWAELCMASWKQSHLDGETWSPRLLDIRGQNLQPVELWC